MMKRKYTDEYVRVMKQIDLSEEAKQRICKKSALHGTLQRIKNGRYAVANTEKKTTES
ncbi:MAG: hypothetical protein IIW48_10340 [Clostridia bacterium]|nr:hypothetical protein [Clostridia bacterium]